MGVVVLLYDLIMIPLYTAFPLQDNVFLSIMAYITLAFWSFDIVACFAVGYYTKDGTLVVSLSRIAKQHLGQELLGFCSCPTLLFNVACTTSRGFVDPVCWAVCLLKRDFTVRALPLTSPYTALFLTPSHLWRAPTQN